jgi:hypothetical protein
VTHCREQYPFNWEGNPIRRFPQTGHVISTRLSGFAAWRALIAHALPQKRCSLCLV